MKLREEGEWQTRGLRREGVAAAAGVWTREGRGV